MGRIASTEELIDYIGVRDPAKVNGRLLGVILAGAEQFVATFTGRQFWAEPALAGNPPTDTAPPVAKTITVRPSQKYVRIPDLRSATSVTLNGAALTPGVGYDIPDTYTEPATRIRIIDLTRYGAALNPWATSVYSTLEITGRWGFVVQTAAGTLGPPDDVKDAILTLAARRWRERDAAWSDSVQTQEGAVFSYFRTMPESVRQVLLMYRPFNFALINESPLPPAQVTTSYYNRSY